uniref:Uncharacterized protein n=1 Tax=Oryza nivara TaxID=4536 RepID=A0A0E0IE64_ORYNI
MDPQIPESVREEETYPRSHRVYQLPILSSTPSWLISKPSPHTNPNPLCLFPSNAFHRTPCDHSLTTARDHHCEAPRPELEVGGSGGRALLPPSPLRESRTAGHREPRIEHLQASPTASRPCFVRTEPRAAELRHPAVSRALRRAVPAVVPSPASSPWTCHPTAPPSHIISEIEHSVALGASVLINLVGGLTYRSSPKPPELSHGGYAAPLASASPRALAAGGRSPEILRVSARQLPSSPLPSRLGPTTPAAPSRASASLGNGRDKRR